MAGTSRAEIAQPATPQRKRTAADARPDGGSDDPRSRRPERTKQDPWKPVHFLAEEERGPDGRVVRGSVVFLTNKECPWRCVMCDLWKHTLTERVPPGAIPAQLDHALANIPAAEQIKLYNSGSFFDAAAIPRTDWPAIAERLRPFKRVIVECHPALVGESAVRFRDLLASGTMLEVAMGLETVHPQVLPRLNKGMTLEQFASAARFLKQAGIDTRAFVLLQPPFMAAAEAVEWTVRSVRFAFDCGMSAVTIIPTRGGNGAMEALAVSGDFVKPRLSQLESALARAIGMQRGRAFADTWDLKLFSDCDRCFSARNERLERMNREQIVLPSVACEACKPLP